jgi:hypothetical protein
MKYFVGRKNLETGRAADVFFDKNEGVYEVRKYNGDLRMGNEVFWLSDGETAQADAIAEAEAFVDGHLTNTEFVYRLMEFAKSGPLMQGFVIEALSKYAGQVLSATEEELGGPNALIDVASWRACAREAQETLEQHLRN